MTHLGQLESTSIRNIVALVSVVFPGLLAVGPLAPHPRVDVIALAVRLSVQAVQ
jgi:hypothetical protein